MDIGVTRRIVLEIPNIAPWYIVDTQNVKNVWICREFLLLDIQSIPNWQIGMKCH